MILNYQRVLLSLVLFLEPNVKKEKLTTTTKKNTHFHPPYKHPEISSSESEIGRSICPTHLAMAYFPFPRF